MRCWIKVYWDQIYLIYFYIFNSTKCISQTKLGGLNSKRQDPRIMWDYDDMPSDNHMFSLLSIILLLDIETVDFRL